MENKPNIIEHPNIKELIEYISNLKYIITLTDKRNKKHRKLIKKLKRKLKNARQTN